MRIDGELGKDCGDGGKFDVALVFCAFVCHVEGRERNMKK